MLIPKVSSSGFKNQLFIFLQKISQVIIIFKEKCNIPINPYISPQISGALVTKLEILEKITATNPNQLNKTCRFITALKGLKFNMLKYINSLHTIMGSLQYHSLPLHSASFFLSIMRFISFLLV